MPLQRLYELYQIASTPWAWHAPLIERAQALGAGADRLQHPLRRRLP